MLVAPIHQSWIEPHPLKPVPPPQKIAVLNSSKKCIEIILIKNIKTFGRETFVVVYRVNQKSGP